MTTPTAPTSVEASVTNSDTIRVSWTFAPTWFAFDGSDSSLGGFNEGLWYSDAAIDHFHIEVDEDGSGFSNPTTGPQTVSYTDGQTKYDATYDPKFDSSSFVYRVSAVNTDGNSKWSETATVFVRPLTSHTTPVTSSVTTRIDLRQSVSSHTSTVTTDGVREVSYTRPQTSHTTAVTSDATRLAVYTRPTDSHVAQIRTWPVVDNKTSLELLDYSVDWDDDAKVWRTQWFPEDRILGNENTLAIVPRIVATAEEPAATIQVEYDGNGNGRVDSRSEKLRVTRDETLQVFEDIPIDTSADAQYRLVISEYSGYNSLYDIQFGLVR